MATNVIHTGSGGRIEVDYSYSQDVTNNTTTISASVYAIRTNSSYYSYTDNGNFKLTIAGVEKSIKWSFNAGNWSIGSRYLIVSNTVTKTHASDGTLADPVIAVYSTSTLQIFGPATLSKSFPFSVPTIARASTATITSPSNKVINMDGTNVSNVVVAIDPKSSIFRHKINVKFNNGKANGWVLANGSLGSHDDAVFLATNASINIPASWTNILNYAATQAGTISIYTYTGVGGTMIGSQYEIPVTFSVSSSLTPTVSNTVTGTSLIEGCYVAGKSFVTVKVNAAGKAGATISSYSTKIEGSTYTSSNFSHGIRTTGSVSVSTTVKDSRGRSASYSRTIYSNAYTMPKITYCTALRSSPNTTVRVSYKATVAPLRLTSTSGNLNSGTAYVRAQVNGGAWSSWSTMASIPLGDTVTHAYNWVGTTATNTYNFEIKITDKFGSVSTQRVVSSVAVPLNIHKDKGSVGIGKYASGAYALEVGDRGAEIGGQLRVQGWSSFFEPINLLSGINPIQIPENTDLNDVSGNTVIKPFRVGFYFCPSDAAAKTMNGRPADTSFSLIQTRSYAITQIWISHEMVPRMYVRNAQAGSWGQWQRVSMIQEGASRILVPGVSGIFSHFQGQAGATHWYVDGRQVTLTIQLAMTGATQGFKTPFGVTSAFAPNRIIRFPVLVGKRLEYATIDLDGYIKVWVEAGEDKIIGTVTYLM